MKGPDFPTGAQILGVKGIHDAYRTGRGSITMRAVITVEELQGRTCLVVTELPYQVNPDNLAIKIADLVKEGKLSGIADIRDESSGRTGQRLVIVLKPRNADNEFVPLAGPITVVLLDYAKRNQGSAALIARWKIDAPTVHNLILNDEYAQGIQLRLPWSDLPPENSKLRLDVRYTTADGRHLDTRADVFVTLPGQFSTRWTPRAPRSRNGGNRHVNGTRVGA